MSTISNASDFTLEHSDTSESSQRDLEGQQDGNQPAARWCRLVLNDRIISDATLGLSDGMTVPFALTAGLSSFGNARLVYLGGLAELIAGAISMGLGGYIAAKGEAYFNILSASRCILANSAQTFVQSSAG